MEYTRQRNSQDIGVHKTKVIHKKLIIQDEGTYKTKVTQKI